MKSVHWSTSALGGSMLLLFAACQTGPTPIVSSMAPVVPTQNEQIVRDQLIVIVDATGSIGTAREFNRQKSTVMAFAAGMPDGVYEAGIDSFAGVPRGEWLNNDLAPFRRTVMVTGASDLEPLGSLTPLARAIQDQTAEFRALGGRGALLIFSDGKVRNPEEVLQACRDLKVAHGGEICIFTVQVGDSARGRKLLQEMAAVNGCGQYYDGASLNTAAAIDELERNIFLGARDVPEPVFVPRPAPKPTLSLNKVLFDNDKSEVATIYDGELEKVVAMLNEDAEMRIQLAGHTDSNASNAYNQALSERRVAAVKLALVSRGADGSRIVTSAYGEERPVAVNNSADNMHQNRRVELTLVD